MKILKDIKEILINTLNDYFNDDMFLHSAALAFYTIFSLAPLLIIVVAASGFIFNAEVSRQQLQVYLEGLVGPNTASTLMDLLAHATQHGRGVIATIISAIVLLFGATTVFTQLKNTLNRIWNVIPKPGETIRTLILDRLMALGTVLFLALLMIISLLFEAILALLRKVINETLPLGVHFWNDVNLAFTILITVILFAIILKVLPDVKIPWWIAWIGSVLSTVLFVIGKYLIGIYLSFSTINVAYGAAGSIIIFLVWVYYNALVIYLGAELTHSIMRHYEHQIHLSKHAMFFQYPDEGPDVDKDALS